MALVDRIVEAFEALGGYARYSDLYAYIEKTIPNLPRTWKDSIRARIEENSSDSKAYKGKQDLFYAVRGLGNGTWGLRNRLVVNLPAIDIEEPIIPTKISEGSAEPKQIEVEIIRVIRDTAMSKQLKSIYQYKCQICGNSITLHNRLYAEAHHLRPLGGKHRGADEAGNILIVCPNHHVEFDFGAIAINPIELTVVHIETKYQFIGKEVLFHKLHKVDEINLAYHINNIFQGT
jgi:hypothetical protein